ncbi:MAG: hypothetical protein AUK47_28600 [Deltaproteobacteria bacterium CG2_30_63_29]|nr:MAG: hypothetical protein AUK47_28600 [Deltaproteobacteria bacterium CG2_30_63_29]PIV98692.1 MAG: hypothetical protein COW42_13455 [Deltaproteobacteria bacterium CG17_big_fil_post_rev_8_21_14_2_50_63_7]PJB47630.1 MAG: hypothetical protein CO108_03815 [Deltaproteobacteria bacterium CG_4_9_14_3_um_filter_63_12]
MLAVLACGPKEVGYNSNSGADGVRDTATQLYLNTSDDDRCNAETGDNEDWKYLLIEQAGVLRVSVRVDNPRMDADLFLHDGFGRAIDRLNITESSDFYEFSEIEVPVGRYYFRVACMKGQSVYTVSAAFSVPEDTAEPATVYVVEAEVQDKDPVEKKVKKVKTKKPDDPVVEKDPPVVVEVKKDDPPVEEPPVTAEPPKKVTGTITLVTPDESGKAKITIRGIGSKYGVTKEMTGKLVGRGKKVTLYDCEARKCQGVVEADQEELKQYDKVEFMVPAQ